MMCKKIAGVLASVLMMLTLAPLSAFAAEPSVQEVEMLASQIGTVTRENRSAVEKAVNAYNQLDDASKSEVSNFSVLAEAQQILGIKDALAKLNVDYDKVDGDYTIDSPYCEQAITKGNCSVNPVIYLREDDDRPWMVIMYHYIGDDYIWADSIVVRAGENRYTYGREAFSAVDAQKVTVSYGKIKSMETLGTFAEDFDVGLLRDALSVQEAIFRFKGHTPWDDVTQYDYVLTPENRQGITDILNAYDLMCSVSPEVLRKALA